VNEAAFWTKVRGALHRPPRWVARKLTDAFTAGTPDAFYVIDGVVGFLELKYLQEWPVRPGTLVKVGDGVTVEQRRYLDMLRAAGARAHVLLGVEREWFLLTPDQVPESNRLERWKLRAPNVPQGSFDDLPRLGIVLSQTLEPGA